MFKVAGKFIGKVYIFALLMLPNTAYAYIDPGSGSAILSAIIGAFVACGLFLKDYWYKFKRFIAPKKVEPDLDIEEK